MADATSQAAPPQEKQAAAQAALADLEQRIFFDVLASRGYAPRNQKQASAMLETASNVCAAREKVAAVKSAADDDFFSQANSALGKALNKQSAAAGAATPNRVDPRHIEDLVTKLADGGWLEAVSASEGKE